MAKRPVKVTITPESITAFYRGVDVARRTTTAFGRRLEGSKL